MYKGWGVIAKVKINESGSPMWWFDIEEKVKEETKQEILDIFVTEEIDNKLYELAKLMGKRAKELWYSFEYKKPLSKQKLKRLV